MIDICVNATNSQFKNDLSEVLQRAADAGVSGMLLTATALSDVAPSLALCDGSSKLCTAGVHPHDAKDVQEDWLVELRSLLQDSNVCAVGECGLDFNRNFSPRDVQLNVFRNQIELACEVGKPLFVHDRESGGAVLTCLTDAAGLPPTVVHCFTGTEAELEKYIEQGFYIGITGWICDTRRGAALQNMVHRIPLERLLVETDAPFLKPHNARAPGRRNEPALLPYVIATISEHRPESQSEIAAATTANAKLLFGFA